MKKNPSHIFNYPVLGLAVAGMLAFSSARGQSTETWDGGTGTWDVNHTAHWNSGNVWANNNDAFFGTGTGTVTVSDQGGTAPVTIDRIEINDAAGGTGYTFTGSPIATEDNGGNTDVVVDSANTSNITFDNEFIVNTTPNAVFGNDQSNFINNSQATVTYGAMDIQNNNGISRTGVQIIALDQAGGTGKTVLAGDITATGVPSGVTPTIWFNLTGGSGGTYEVKGSIADGIHLQYNTFGTVLLDTSNLGDQNFNVIGVDYTDPTQILTEGAQTVSIGIQTQNDTLLYIGGSTNDTSAYTGTINVFAQTDLVVANGGRVNFNTQLQGQLGTGLTTAGDGTIALNNGTGNSYGTAYRLDGFNQGTVAATLGATMTLINNTSGTAFGGGSAKTVNLLANSGLGGTGITHEKIVAADSTSVIAPGNPGDAHIGDLPSVGTLQLTGNGDPTTAGIEADNGLTLDFKLDGANNDKIDLAGADLSLNGTVNVNFSVLAGGVVTGTPYTLMFASIDGETWSGDPTFNIVAPAGYGLDLTYNGTGYDFDTNLAGDLYSSGDTFSVQFIAVPEPSTCALMLGALVLLSFWVRRKVALLS